MIKKTHLNHNGYPTTSTVHCQFQHQRSPLWHECGHKKLILFSLTMLTTYEFHPNIFLNHLTCLPLPRDFKLFTLFTQLKLHGRVCLLLVPLELLAPGNMWHYGLKKKKGYRWVSFQNHRVSVSTKHGVDQALLSRNWTRLLGETPPKQTKLDLSVVVLGPGRFPIRYDRKKFKAFHSFHQII